MNLEADQNQYVERSLEHLETATGDEGGINNALEEIYSDLLSNNLTTQEKNEYLHTFTQKVHEKALFPEAVEAYVSENFGNLDLDDSGWISKDELESIQNNKVISGAMTPFEKQLVRYMSSNIDTIASGANDEVGFENNGISQSDVKGFSEKQKSKENKSAKSQALNNEFGDEESFSKLDKDGNGYLSSHELNEAIANKNQNQELLRFMQSHKKEIFKSSDDETFFESEITLEDIREFAKENEPEQLDSSMFAPIDFSVESNTNSESPITRNSSLEDLFSNLDLNDNGYISSGELTKFQQTKKWMDRLSDKDQSTVKSIENNFESILRSSNDEWGYENNGISVSDLKTNARNQLENLKQIPTEPGDHIVRIKDQGADRSFLMHIPKSYDGKEPMPIVVMLHGILQNSEEIAEKTGLSKLADENNFIAIYPDSQGWVGDNIRSWSIGQKYSIRNVDDGKFVDTVIQSVQDKLNIDQDKVFVAGYSNGAMLAHEVACRFPDKLAAVAAVNGTMNGCEIAPETPVPVMMLNAMGDKVIPHQGRTFVEGIWPLDMESASYSRNFWAQNNGAKEVSFSKPQPGLMKRKFKGETDRADVVSYMIQDGNHVWPGANQEPFLGLKTDLRFDASQMVWDFFSNYSR